MGELSIPFEGSELQLVQKLTLPAPQALRLPEDPLLNPERNLGSGFIPFFFLQRLVVDLAVSQSHLQFTPPTTPCIGFPNSVCESKRVLHMIMHFIHYYSCWNTGSPSMANICLPWTESFVDKGIACLLCFVACMLTPKI